MKKLGFVFLLALFVYMAASPVPNPGVVYEIEVKDHEQSPPKTESIQAAVEGRYLKMGVASKGRSAQGEMIFRGDRRELVVVDHENKSYHVMDEAAVRQISGQVDEAMRLMQGALLNVTEDKRAMIEQMMKQRLPIQTAARPRRELKKTSERATQNGYPCVKYEVWEGDRIISELWVTDWDALDGGGEARDAFRGMGAFFDTIRKALLSNSGGADPFGGRNPYDEMKFVDGFPVVTKDFNDDGSLAGEIALRSAKRQTIDPDAFEPPSGYKRQEMFGGQ